MKRNIAVAIAILAGSTAAFAGPTALILMPIADVLGNREAIYQFLVTGNERNVDKAHYFDSSLTVGINDIAEVGFDQDLLGRTTLNWKVQLYASKDPSKFAVSTGMQNIGLLHSVPDKYVCARYDVKAFRLHAGYIYNDRNRLMLGLDGPLPRGFSWCTDYISGPGSYIWASLNVPLPIKGFQLAVSGGIPGRHGDGIQHQLSVSYGFKLK